MEDLYRKRQEDFEELEDALYEAEDFNASLQQKQALIKNTMSYYYGQWFGDRRFAPDDLSFYDEDTFFWWMDDMREVLLEQRELIDFWLKEIGEPKR